MISTMLLKDLLQVHKNWILISAIFLGLFSLFMHEFLIDLYFLLFFAAFGSAISSADNDKRIRAIASLPISQRKLANTMFLESVLLFPAIIFVVIGIPAMLLKLSSHPLSIITPLFILFLASCAYCGTMHFIRINQRYIGITKNFPSGFLIALFSPQAWSFWEKHRDWPYWPAVLLGGLALTVIGWWQTPNLIVDGFSGYKEMPGIESKVDDKRRKHRKVIYRWGRWWPVCQAFILGACFSLFISGLLAFYSLPTWAAGICIIPGVGILRAYVIGIRLLRALPYTSWGLIRYLLIIPIGFTIGAMLPITLMMLWQQKFEWLYMIPVPFLFSVTTPVLFSSLEMRWRNVLLGIGIIYILLMLPLLAIPFRGVSEWIPWFIAVVPIVALPLAIYWLHEAITRCSGTYRSRNVEGVGF